MSAEYKRLMFIISSSVTKNLSYYKLLRYVRVKQKFKIVSSISWHFFTVLAPVSSNSGLCPDPWGRCCSIVAHVHNELIIEAGRRMSLKAVCEQMERTPPWAEGLLPRVDGYETEFYKKD
jgi:hypothetical protein